MSSKQLSPFAVVRAVSSSVKSRATGLLSMLPRNGVVPAHVGLHVVNPADVPFLARQSVQPRAARHVLVSSGVEPDIIDTLIADLDRVDAVDAALPGKAIAKYKIDPDKPNPVTV